MDDGGSDGSAPGATARASCALCARLKKRCTYDGASDACTRCVRLSKSCEPADTSLSRRQREKLRRAGRLPTALSRPAESGSSGSSAGPSPGANLQSELAEQVAALSASAAAADAAAASLARFSVNAPKIAAEALSGTIVPALPPLSYAASSPAGSGSISSPPAGSPWSPFSPPAWLSSMSDGIASPPMRAAAPDPYFAPEGTRRTFAPPAGSPPTVFAAWPLRNETPAFVLPAPSPNTGPQPSFPADQILSAVSAYWTYVHPMLPILHRPSIEAAFSTLGEGSVYGSSRPLALLYLMAALGVRELVATPEVEKLRMAKACSEKAKELLLAGHLGHAPGAARMTDLEALQCVILLLQTSFPAGQSGGSQDLLAHALGAMRRLCLDAEGRFVCGSRKPATAAEWITNESALRCYTTFASVEIGLAYFAVREPIYDFFERPIPLPCEETLFDQPTPESAFEHLTLSSSTSPANGTIFVDFGRFLLNPTPDGARAMVLEILGPVLSGRCSPCSVIWLNTVLRVMRHRLRSFAAMRGIDAVAAMTKNSAFCGPAETAYRERVRACDLIVSTFFASLPTSVAGAVADGIIRPLLRPHGPFVTLGSAHYFLSTALVLESFVVEQFFGDSNPPGLPRDAPLAPYFPRLLRASSSFCASLAGLLHSNPPLRWIHFILVAPSLRVGAVALAALRASPPEDPDRPDPAQMARAAELRTVARALDAIAERFGSLTRFYAEGFKKAMLEAGVQPDPAPAIAMAGLDGLVVG